MRSSDPGRTTLILPAGGDQPKGHPSLDSLMGCHWSVSDRLRAWRDTLVKRGDKETQGPKVPLDPRGPSCHVIKSICNERCQTGLLQHMSRVIVGEPLSRARATKGSAPRRLVVEKWDVLLRALHHCSPQPLGSGLRNSGIVKCWAPSPRECSFFERASAVLRLQP